MPNSVDVVSKIVFLMGKSQRQNSKTIVVNWETYIRKFITASLPKIIRGGFQTCLFIEFEITVNIV
jgi:hypothetical protein